MIAVAEQDAFQFLANHDSRFCSFEAVARVACTHQVFNQFPLPGIQCHRDTARSDRFCPGFGDLGFVLCGIAVQLDVHFLSGYNEKRIKISLSSLSPIRTADANEGYE
jgi:hypothetical protein